MWNKRFRNYTALTVLICAAFGGAEPLSSCSFYKPNLLPLTFASGVPNTGCAEFSAVLGRRGCKKIKGTCPFCVKYPGDHVQMWLPDYFIEVTKHIGKSLFTSLPTGSLLATQLSLAQFWASTTLLAPTTSALSNGTHSESGSSSFWHARIITVPYGLEVNNYPPLRAPSGTGFPHCYSAISEFYTAQWQLNLSDSPFALAWMPIGLSLCNNPGVNLATELFGQAKKNISSLTSTDLGTGGGFIPSSFQCALPVGAKEGTFKNTLPTSDALSPLRSPQKLCMGSWGNLLPRTGMISTDDPLMSALIAAYKFQSLAADFNLNAALKMVADDKWQIVYPPRHPATCFSPGSSLTLPLQMDDPLTRAKDELSFDQKLKDHTYVIAVWRRRESCEEPLSQIDGWNKSYKANFIKNKTACQTLGLF